jgi:hypothetical protein
MPRLIAARPLEDYRLAIRFDDGTAGEISVKERLFGPVFEPLQDRAFFAQVFVDEFGAITWPNGADLAPDALYAQLQGSGEIATRR